MGKKTTLPFRVRSLPLDTRAFYNIYGIRLDFYEKKVILMNSFFLEIKQLALEIEFFETKSGNSPVEKYIESLENEQVENILSQIEQLSILGVKGMPYKMIKSVKGIFYLRIRDRKGIHRVFFTVEKGKILLLLHAFGKKEQKLKNTDINQAAARLKEWRMYHGKI